ncbi:ABC transporter permease [Cohnella zeiphila]|uniref:Sugar ABC transporter permease n=1 Tax=Cohnella zeiphila TaxID=2761120 RepID=A0A7X0SQW9_9BACL|nr:ABC transporter permease subunit [Cohnella zeiphila]MBB6734510.1 sugar ABC transporter permease [Cohnella zeiphila]
MNARLKRELPLYLLILPGVLLVLVYNYVPMLGSVIAFQKFVPALGVFKSKWIGLDNFQYLFALPSFEQVLWNTVLIACMKIAAGLIVAIAVAVFLNEMLHEKMKRLVQTFIYLPHFLSWVVLGGILIEILSPNGGIVNRILAGLGINPIFFLGSNHWFQPTLVVSDVWKEFGFGTIVFLAAITGIDPALYESAELDGASRLRKMRHITLPGLASTIVLMMTLSLGNVLNAGFDQIFNLYSPVVYQSGDILDTMVYRIGFEDAQYGVATALGMFKSVVSLPLISVAYWLAYRFANYRIF